MLKILPSKIRGFTHPIKPCALTLSLFQEAFFSLVKLLPQSEITNSKFKNEVILEGFIHQK
jgi:hypothetical protein